MKAYKRQRIVTAVLLGAMAIGSTGTAFAATNSVNANDINNKQVVTKMHKDSTLDTKSSTPVNSKKTKKKHKKNTSTGTTLLDNHKDGEKKDDKVGAPNGDETKKTNNTASASSTIRN